MLERLARNWWVITLRGALAILFGVLAFVWPVPALAVLVILFASYALIGGIFAVIGAISNSVGGQRWWVLVEGIAGIIAGVLTLVWPGITSFTLVIFIGFWAIISGVFEIFAAIDMRKIIKDEWLFVLSGILSIVFGFLILARPLAGALVIVWMVAFYAVTFGITMIILGIRLRSLKTKA